MFGIAFRRGRTSPSLDMISRRGKVLELISLDLSLSFIDDVVRDRENPTGRLLIVNNRK